MSVSYAQQIEDCYFLLYILKCKLVFKLQKRQLLLVKTKKKMNKDLKYFKSIAKIASDYSKGDYSDLKGLNNALNEIKKFSHYLEGIVNDMEKGKDVMIGDMLKKLENMKSSYSQQPSELSQAIAQPVPAVQGDWMSKKDACRKYDLSGTTFDKKTRGYAETRKSGRRVEYLITEDMEKKLKTDLRSLRYKGKNEANEVNADKNSGLVKQLLSNGYISRKELAKKCNVTAAGIDYRMKTHNIKLEKKEVGHSVYYKQPSDKELSLLKGSAEPQNLEGYIPKNEMLKKVKLTDVSFYSRAKAYKIDLETKRIGLKLYFKELKPFEAELIKHRKLKCETIDGIKKKIQEKMSGMDSAENAKLKKKITN